MQSGRKPLESLAEYNRRKDDYLAKLRIVTTMLAFHKIKLEEYAKTLEDDYSLDYPEWANILGGIEDIEVKLNKFVEETINNR